MIFEMSNISENLRRLADEIDRIEKETGYSPVSITMDRDWNRPDNRTFCSTVLFRDKRWYV